MNKIISLPSLGCLGSVSKIAAISLGLACSSQAQAVLNFDFVHGTTVTDQYKSLYGVDVSAISLANGSGDPEDNAIVFDTEITGTTSDPDLQRTGVSAVGWSGGNLGADYVAGGALILPENDDRVMGSDLYSDPDDNIAGGRFIFKVDADRFYSSFSTVLVDFEESGSAWNLVILGQNGVSHTLSYSDVIGSDTSIASGDNFVNRLPIVDATDYGIDYIKQLDIILDQSSGAIGELTFNPKDANVVPEPATSLMVFVGTIGFLFRRRR